MTDTTGPDYLRGVDDALAEVLRRLSVANRLGDVTSHALMVRILDETARELHGRCGETGSLALALAVEEGS